MALVLLLLMIPLSFIFIGFIFICTGTSKKKLYSSPKIKYTTTGVLVGFRETKKDHTSMFEEYRTVGDQNIDHDRNISGTRPLFKFVENGKTVQVASEFSTSKLNKNDIGKEIQIFCFSNHEKHLSRLIIDNSEQREKLKRAAYDVPKRFVVIGRVLIGLAIMLVIASSIGFKMIENELKRGDVTSFDNMELEERLKDVENNIEETINTN